MVYFSEQMGTGVAPLTCSKGRDEGTRGVEDKRTREDQDEWRRDKAVSPLTQSSLDFFSRSQQFGWSQQTESLEQVI